MSRITGNIIQLALISLVLFLLGAELQAQSGPYSLQGQVTDANGRGIPFATVLVANSGNGTAADLHGYFSLNNIPNPESQIIIESVGYEDRHVRLTKSMLNGELKKFTLKKADINLNEVVIAGKSKELEIREKAYSVSALDAKKFRNSNYDVGNLLKRVSGVNIREAGGLGSDFKFSINGLSGKQVKFFIDGIPMENYGSSYNINSIPVNLIERVEVYKGVVPVWLGRDALGGAVNIITNSKRSDYLDLSYSSGSFNTHKASLNAQVISDSSGFVLKTSAYYNYSDNDYRVDNIETHDKLGNVTGTSSFTRFHDAYESAMVQVKAGITGKSFADKLLFGLTASGNRDNVQHGVSLERVFGQVHTKDRILMPTFEYQKDDLLMDGLDVSAYASYIDGQYEVADTSSREYRWDGSYTIRNNPGIGESDWQKSLFTFNDETLLAVGNIKYEKGSHLLAFNTTASQFTREGDDPFDPDIVPFSDPNFLKKTIFGLSYTRHFLEKRLSFTPFVKYFLYSGKTIEEDVYSDSPGKIIHNYDFNRPGYGFATRFEVHPNLKLKASYENTYRLPDGSETFGDGLNVLSNPLLEPEHSQNINAGILYNKISGYSSWIFEANVFSRKAENLIRQAADGAKSQYVNLARVSVQGIESEVSYGWNNRLTATVNMSYQHLVNKTKFDEAGGYNYTFNDRLPNIPYLFGNSRISYRFSDLMENSDALSITLISRYVHEFYLQWPSQGAQKYTIPGQFTHSLTVNYSMKNGKYNASLGSTNLLNDKVYDNFRVQKPGRAIYIKLRYSIN